ncbi:MAG: hypothetical protein ABIP21_06865 [Acidimicrobiia bacterium]
MDMDFERALQDETVGIVADTIRPDQPPATLLIAFGGLASRLDGIPPFEFLSALSETAARRVFVRDLSQSWYQEGVRGVSSTLATTTDALRALVAESDARRVVTLGVSAGGFAAIYFGCQLDADFVLAFGPQTFTSRRLRGWYRDRRWVEEIARINALDPATTCRDLKPIVAARSSGGHTPIEIHYGRHSRVDRAHARRLRRFANVTLIEHDAGHNPARALKEAGELDSVLRRAVTPPT